MHPSIESIRQTFRLSPLCQVFEANLLPCIEDDFHRHCLHLLPSAVIVEDRGQRLVHPNRWMGCIYRLVRHSGLELLPEEQPPMADRVFIETLYLAMPVGDHLVLNSRRTRFLKEAEDLLLDLMQEVEHVYVAAITHRRLIHGHLIIRHQPVALIDLLGRLLWLHPAGCHLGLLATSFPIAQRQRHVDPPSLRGTPRKDFHRQDERGYPVWFIEARQSPRNEVGIARPTQEPPSLNQSLLQRCIEAEAEAEVPLLSEEYLNQFETFFGKGGLMPTPGVVDPF